VESITPRHAEARSEEATSKKTLDDLEDDEVTADLKDRAPVPSPDGTFAEDEERDEAN
jgi:hypothetical protein